MMKARIEELQIQNEFLIVNEKMPLYPIIKRIQLFIRPTNTDGDAISIRESLYYKVPTIASDVCKRPKGTISFRNRDINDLYNKTADVIDNYEQYKNKLKSIVFNDNIEKVLDVYKKLIKK
jgi:hypothetical protein